jgi:Flp pilus assembly protein TadG
MTRRRITAEGGQTATEFALVLPLFLALVLAIVQFGIAFKNYVTLTDAARAGARKAIVARLAGGTTGDAEAAVRAAAGTLDQTKLQVTVSSDDWTTSGSDVTVATKYPYSISLMGWVVASGSLSSTMKERLE